ncbi:MAG: hypothetical protein RIF39_03885 [Cyclobacteriaceae bacterium]
MLSQPLKQSAGLAFVLLPSRLLLFLIFQSLVALVVNSWHIAEKYWLLTATLANSVSIILLFFGCNKEGKNYLSLFRIDRSDLKKDVFIFLVLAIISIPIVFAPGYFLSLLLWNDPNVPAEMMFGEMERGWVYLLLVIFPLTITFAELPTYFGYIMPKLEKQLQTKWLAVLLPVLFLSIQHCALPFIPDFNFIVYRALVFLPFAALIGISIYCRPALLPYFAVLHGVMDFGAAFMFL